MVAYELGIDRETGEKKETYLQAGENPPDGVVVQYWFRERPKGEVTLTFLDARGKTIGAFSSRPDEQSPPRTPEAAPRAEDAGAVGRPIGAAESAKREPTVPKRAGLNRFIWNMRYPDATKVDNDASMNEFERALAGAVAVPGSYRVRLQAEGKNYAADFETQLDPRATVPQRDLEAQFELLMRIREKLSEVHAAINRIRTIRSQVEGWEKRAANDQAARAVVKAAAKLRRELTSIEEELIQTNATSRRDTFTYPMKLNAKLGELAAAAGMGDAAPTYSMREVFADLSRRVDGQIARLERTMKGEVHAFEALVRRSRILVIDLPARQSPTRAKAAARRQGRGARVPARQRAR